MSGRIKRDKELRFSVKERKNIDPLSYRIRKIENGVRVLEARERGVSESGIYSYRFNKKLFTFSQAKKWLDEHEIIELLKFN